MALVLAVIVAVAAMVLPALQGPMHDQRLRKAGDIVRAQWATARTTAMRTGQMQVFRYEIGTDRYRVEPWYHESDALAAPAANPAPELSLPPDHRNAHSPIGVPGARLPSDVRFFSADTAPDPRLAGTQQDAPVVDTGAVPPIVFYPDGSASDARLVLTNDRFFVELHLRGLTGLSRSSDLLAAEELSP
jgi:hypothetical protein